jgi:ATP/maltotriose-dependent transcriptional regulator MalT
LDAHSLTLGLESSSAILERDEELLAAAHALERCADGRGSLLAVQGPVGSGKSRLTSAVADLAAADGFEVLYGAGRERERGFALGMVLQLFEARVAAASDGEREALFAGPAAPALSVFAPGLGQDAADSSFPLLHGLYWLCARLAERSRLLLRVDDADLSDAESLRFLLYLTERLDSLPVVLLVTHGSTSAGEDDLFTQLSQHPRAVRCSLQPLSRSACTLRLRTAWLAESSDAVCDAVYAATQGNPWLVDVLGAALADEPGLPPELVAHRGVAPIATTALSRARSVHPRAPLLLRAAAVLGSHAELRNLARLAGMDAADAARVVYALAELGLLTPAPHHSVAHAVVRRAILGSLPLAERGVAYRRAAELLAEEEAPPEQVGDLLQLATPAGEAWAVDVLAAAGALALARGEPRRAVGYLRRALDEPPPRDRRAHVMLELGRAEAAVGDPRAEGRLREALERVTDGPERAHTALETSRTLLALGRPHAAASALKRGAAGATGELAERLEVAQLTMGRLLDPTAEAAPFQLPEEPAGAADRARLALGALDAAVRGEPHARARALAEAALGRGKLLDEETSDGVSYYLASLALVVTEDLSTAEAALTAAVQDAQSRGSVLGFASASFARSLAIMRRGRVLDAGADAQRAIDVEPHGWRMATAGPRAVLALNLIEQGDLAGAARHVAAAEAIGDEDEPSRVTWLATRGRLRLLEGDPEAALADFMRCGELLEGWGCVNPAVTPWMHGAAAALAARGDWAEARRLAEAQVVQAERFGAPGALGSALRTLGLVRNDDGTLDTLRAAVDMLESSQTALDRAYALVDYGSALRRAGRRRDARDPLRRGADLAQRCGAAALAARAVEEVKVAGARPRRVAMAGVESLTPRERQVAELAARGLSNREIAETLVVTLKTVEFHLKHTYRKLGVESRRALRDSFGPD